MTDLTRDTDPDQPTKGHSGEGVNSADHLEKGGATSKEKHQEDLLDEAVDETFPASDPISPKHIT
jgi:hypothetical protein